MYGFVPPSSDCSRRELLRRVGMGFGSLGLAALMRSELVAKAPDLGPNPLLPRRPHLPVKAKRVIHVFLNGGPSQVDTFDPKPMLDRYHGRELPKKLITERPTGACLRSPFAFGKYGQSGMDFSEIFRRTARCADEFCLIRSMQTDLPNHEPSMMMMNTGDVRLPRPSLGSWLTYGLGTENQNLPGYISLCPGLPTSEVQNWQSAFLPGVFQGTHIDTRETNVEKLIADLRHDSLSRGEQREQLDLLQRMNLRHARERDQDPQLEARIQSFELAFRMQLEATDAFDVSREPSHIRALYGPGVQARQLLMARRLVERGVRFVQVFHKHGQPWDSHEKIAELHGRLGRECDQGIAGLITDLKQRGMLEDTLVVIGGEFGRTPVVELPRPGFPPLEISGRDHNHYGFSMLLAGGGVRRGMTYGSTCEFGYEAVENPVHVHDLHATILRLMGFRHEDLTYRHAGRDFRLTDVYGNVVKAVIA
jgi:hypothetical protein